MAELQFETTIQRPAEAVFALIADLPNYGMWLPPSNLYRSLTEYSRLPIARGTEYVDQGRMTRMVGRVTEFQPPTHIAFRQSTVSVAGSLTVEIRYTLEAQGEGTRVKRMVNVRPGGGYVLIGGVVLGPIRKESERILAMMKAHLEKSG